MSYRSYPSQSSYVPPPNQNPIPPPPSRVNQNQNQNQYPPNRTYQNPNSHHSSSSSSNHYAPLPPPPLQPPQQYPYVQPPPPPALNSSQPPPPMYYPSSSSQSYSQFNPHSIPPPPPSAAPPPPPPSTPPHNSVIPPPPPTSNPPSHPPPPPSGKERSRKDPSSDSGWRSSSGHSKHGGGLPPKQHKSSSSSVPGRVPHGPNGPAGRVETEEERKARKKREYEKQRQDEKHRHHQLKESQSNVLHKTQMLSSSAKGHGSVVGSRLGDKRTPFLTAERAENRLKKPTTFLCKLKFRNELPDPTAQPKLLSMNNNKDQYTKYTITSLEKMYKPQLFVEPDLGIPLDLLDLSVYNPPSVKPPLDPEDEELLRDDELTTPVKQNGIKKKDRPEDKGFSWLVKTQYISPLSMDQAKMSLTEKQAKELRETKGGRNILDNLNDRESQIKAIEASFEAAKSVPVHSKDPNLYPVEILPLLPDFDRYEDQFVLASFDNDPTADSEAYNKLPKSTREDLESKAIMKSFVGGGSGSEKFLAYMVPSADELDKDIYEEHEEISYNWVREYNWDVRGDTGDDPSSFLVTFGKDSAKYVPLGTKLNLRKKRAKEGRSHEEVEHYPVPSRITVRNRPPPLEIKESGGYNNKNRKDSTPNSKRGRPSMDDVHERRHKAARQDDMDNFSEAEDDMSE